MVARKTYTKQTYHTTHHQEYESTITLELNDDKAFYSAAYRVLLTTYIHVYSVQTHVHIVNTMCGAQSDYMVYICEQQPLHHQLIKLGKDNFSQKLQECCFCSIAFIRKHHHHHHLCYSIFISTHV